MSRCPTGRVAAEVAPVTEGVSATEIASAAGEEGRAAPGHVAATATAAVTAAAGAVPPRTGQCLGAVPSPDLLRGKGALAQVPDRTNELVIRRVGRRSDGCLEQGRKNKVPVLFLGPTTKLDGPYVLMYIVQGVSRLLYFLRHPFSRTYIDTAGCPFTC